MVNFDVDYNRFWPTKGALRLLNKSMKCILQSCPLLEFFQLELSFWNLGSAGGTFDLAFLLGSNYLKTIKIRHRSPGHDYIFAYMPQDHVEDASLLDKAKEIKDSTVKEYPDGPYFIINLPWKRSIKIDLNPYVMSYS